MVVFFSFRFRRVRLDVGTFNSLLAVSPRAGSSKTSGFEKLYARVTKLYFGGMARHLSELTKVLKPGARLAYVVGDQASYLQIMIRTGQILADIADRLGYQVERIDLFRTRFATATQSELREEIVILRWPGQQAWHSFCVAVPGQVTWR